MPYQKIQQPCGFVEVVAVDAEVLSATRSYHSTVEVDGLRSGAAGRECLSWMETPSGP